MIAPFVIGTCLLLQPFNFGKSDTEILSMGREDWVNYYSERVGSSTAAMCDAETGYGNVLKRVNDKMMTSKNRAEMASVRKMARSYGMATYEMGYAASEGGTLWNQFMAGVHPDTEELVAALINKSFMPLTSYKVSDVTKKFARLETVLAEVKASGQADAAAAETQKKLTEMKKGRDVLIAYASKKSRAHSDAVLGFIVDRIEVVLAFLGDE